MEQISDTKTINDIDEKFKTLIYIDNYAYSNNKVTKKPMFSQNDSNIIAQFFVDSVYCASNSEKPSVEKPKQIKIYKEDIESSYDNIKIVSNFIEFENGNYKQIKGEVIHALNKNIVSLDEKSKELLNGRENILLLGDGLPDLKMSRLTQ